MNKMKLNNLTILKNSHITFGICLYGGTKILFLKAGCKGHVKSKVEGHCQKIAFGQFHIPTTVVFSLNATITAWTAKGLEYKAQII